VKGKMNEFETNTKKRILEARIEAYMDLKNG
jgi:hypothetical protein